MLGFINQNKLDTLVDDSLINVLMDISFFRDMLEPNVYQTYFLLLEDYTSS